MCDGDAPSPVCAASTTTLCIRKPPAPFGYSNPNAIGSAAVQRTSNASAVASRRGVDAVPIGLGSRGRSKPSTTGALVSIIRVSGVSDRPSLLVRNDDHDSCKPASPRRHVELVYDNEAFLLTTPTRTQSGGRQ